MNSRRFNRKTEEIAFTLLVDAYVLMDSISPPTTSIKHWKETYEHLAAMLVERGSKRVKRKKEKDNLKLQKELETQEYLDTTYECGKPQVGWSPDGREFCQDCWDDWHKKGLAVRSLPATGGVCKQRIPKLTRLSPAQLIEGPR